MATINISIESATAIYQVAERAKAGDASLTTGELILAITKAGAAVSELCKVVEPWTPGQKNNVMMAGPGWMVSFKTASDTGKPETALLNKDSNSWFMLSGDHRAAYQAEQKHGIHGMMKVYEALREQYPHDGLDVGQP